MKSYFLYSTILQTQLGILKESILWNVDYSLH